MARPHTAASRGVVRTVLSNPSMMKQLAGMLWDVARGRNHFLSDPDPLTVTLRASLGDQLGPKELRRLALRCLLVRGMIELDHEDMLRGARVERVENAEPLRHLREAKRGVIVCSIHYGPFFYVPLELVRMGFDTHVFMIQDLVRDYAPLWAEVIRDADGTLDCLAAESTRNVLRAVRGLRAGHACVVNMDGNVGAEGLSVGTRHRAEFEFLGVPMRMRVGPAFLSSRAGVPVVLALTRRKWRGPRQLVFSDPLEPPRDGSEEAQTQFMREIYAWFESRVREEPQHWHGWFWPYRLWPDTGELPPVPKREWEAALTETTALLARGGGARKLRADKTAIGLIQKDGRYVVYEGGKRRFLESDVITHDLLRRAFRGITVNASLPGKLKQAPDETARLVTRVVLAGLASYEQ